jgi:SAM-dependent methyltransferase
MVERGRARTRAEGYEIEWVVADAEALPFEDGRFDCVGSVFGVFLAPRPDVASRELLRVVRPGGTVGLTVWTPEGIMAELFAITRDFAPPEPDLTPSERWGDEATARERLESLAASVEFERHTLAWSGESPGAFAEELTGSAPPMVAARHALGPDRFTEMSDRLSDLMARRNGAADGSLRIEAEYAVIVARKRG